MKREEIRRLGLFGLKKALYLLRLIIVNGILSSIAMQAKTLFLSMITLSAFFSGSLSAADEDEMGCLSGDCVNGRGTFVEMTYRGLIKYTGSFSSEKYHGYGRLTYLDERSVYKGGWSMGERSGRGIYWDKENNVYMGQWRDDRRNGEGSQFYKVAGWKEGQHGESWLMENTENYTGHFQNDVFYGDGTYRWPDGVKYIGEWAANMKHGKGYFDYGTGFRSNRIYEFDVKVFD